MSSRLMRAVSIVSHGGPESLSVREVARPEAPTADQVLVRVRAAGLNRADVLQRMGKYPAPPGYPQEIPGLEFAGVVEELGPAVRRWQVGQRVFGITGGGAQAEYLVVPEGSLAPVPSNLDWAQAAAVPEVFITAHDALFTQAALQMGERVLVHAAGSGVGTSAVQLAHAAGATVYGTSRDAGKLQRARELGLDEAITVASEPFAFVEAVRERTRGAGVNVVLDLVGGSYFPANVEALSEGGRLVFVGTTAGASAQLDIGAVMRKRLRLMGTVLRSRSAEEKALVTRRFIAHVVPLLETGRVRPIIDSTFPMEEVRAAHERMESNEGFGKIVLLVNTDGE